MKKAAWIALGVLALLAVLVAMAVAAFLVWHLPQELGTVTVDGKLIDLHGAHAGHWLLATLCILLAGVIVMVLVPTFAILALIVPIAFSALGLAVAALAIGLMLSPLILLIWWLWKRSGKPETIAA